MVDEDSSEREPEDTDEGGPVAARKGRRSFAKMRRELSEEELSTPAVQKLLIDETERLEAENGILAEFREKYHEADKRAAILEERDKDRVATEVIFGTCLTIGAAILGYTPSVWSALSHGWLLGVFGIILILAGIASKVVKR